jgi:hypothetical protein
MRQWLC